MIGSLTGRAVEREPDRLLIEVGGVGYEVLVPVSTYVEVERRATAEEGPPEVRLHVHTHLREDGLTLFGFWTGREKRLFLKLIAVSGIGPKLARVVLSGMPPDDLVTAIARGDAARLATIPGIGKKTAERMVLELRDKVGDLAAALPPRPAEGGDEEVVSALVNLGYKRPQAERAVGEVRRELPEADFPELLRKSLARLSRV
ncbi:MAG TPA: Holliday junction branch migration protein RuvA [Thermoanaerobaculia bacterium]|nr:Holliday junction branch migration protein RuvA [Thermoanaerobaculia bacterium]